MADEEIQEHYRSKLPKTYEDGYSKGWSGAKRQIVRATHVRLWKLCGIAWLSLIAYSALTPMEFSHRFESGMAAVVLFSFALFLAGCSISDDSWF